MMGRRWPWFCVLLLVSGCGDTTVHVYEPSDAVQKLPLRHQRNIADGLARMFGTPAAPRLMIAKSSQGDSPESDSPGQESKTLDDYVRLMDPLRLARGATVYQARCAGCHGVSGNGKGLAASYLRPRPRDYRGGIFKFTSTPYGAKPARQDLVRIIRRGAKGTSMPAFPWMSEDDLQATVDYVILLSLRGEVEQAVAEAAEYDYDEDEDLDEAEFVDALQRVREEWKQAESQVVLPASAEPPYDLVSIREGRELFIRENCHKCHGERAEGQTEWLSHEFLAAQASLPEDQRILINYDAWNEPAPAADLNARMLHGGRRSIDIYRRIHTGINGTPMPAFGEVFADRPEAIWHLVHYVRYIVEGGNPLLP